MDQHPGVALARRGAELSQDVLDLPAAAHELLGAGDGHLFALGVQEGLDGLALAGMTARAVRRGQRATAVGGQVEASQVPVVGSRAGLGRFGQLPRLGQVEPGVGQGVGQGVARGKPGVGTAGKEGGLGVEHRRRPAQHGGCPGADKGAGQGVEHRMGLGGLASGEEEQARMMSR
jgi:hypothetical protein